MKKNVLTELLMVQFEAYLIQEERSAATIEKYLRDIHAFYRWLPQDKTVKKEFIIAYKQSLASSYQAASINSMLVALNCLWTFLKWPEFRVKLLKIQKKSFRDAQKELSREEYERLVQTAKSCKKERLCLMLQTICCTGIRVSEHGFITAEAVKRGYAQIRNKGKDRVVYLPEALCRKLVQYCRKHSIESGPVFITRSGKPINRSNIWSEMKSLCSQANVDPNKVFPHNLRHLFAVTFYRMEKDIVHLADILGHASIETTRIYTKTSGIEHLKQLSRLRLVI